MIADQMKPPFDAVCAPDMIARMAQHAPNAVAIEALDTTLAYGDLETRVGSLAARLREQGVSTGGLVAVCLPRSIDQIVAMLAAWRAGAAYLPLDPAWPEQRLASLVAGADCAYDNSVWSPPFFIHHSSSDRFLQHSHIIASWLPWRMIQRQLESVGPAISRSIMDRD